MWGKRDASLYGPKGSAYNAEGSGYHQLPAQLLAYLGDLQPWSEAAEGEQSVESSGFCAEILGKVCMLVFQPGLGGSSL